MFSSFLLGHDMAKFYGRALFLGILKDIFHSNCTIRIDLERRKTSFLQDGNFCLVHDGAISCNWVDLVVGIGLKSAFVGIGLTQNPL